MAVERPCRGGLAQADHALSGLLDALLAEATGPSARGEAPAPLNRPPRLPLEQDGSGADAPRPAEREPAGGAPAWARQPFQVVVFAVGDARFAMPLLRMASVARPPARLGRLPGQPAWVLGVARIRGRNVTVVDLGGLVGITAHCRQARYLLVVGNGTAAVACDRIDDVETVRPDAVRWPARPAPGQWLAGMLLYRLCALVDPVALENGIRHA
jgi:chemotaxis signal transduction protein